MSAPCSLYRYFDAAGHLLYVGISSNPAARLAQHRGDKTWWLEVDSIKLESFPTREDALRAEAVAIVDEAPRYNVQGSPTADWRPTRRTMLMNLLTTAQVADRFRVSRRTVARWVVDGSLTAAMTLPGKTGANLFDPAEVERFAAEQVPA